MGSKNKLKRFKENETFSNLIQPDREALVSKDYNLKGKWAKEIFKNKNDIVLELGCGKGEYTLYLAKKYYEVLKWKINFLLERLYENFLSF